MYRRCPDVLDGREETDIESLDLDKLASSFQQRSETEREDQSSYGGSQNTRSQRTASPVQRRHHDSDTLNALSRPRNAIQDPTNDRSRHHRRERQDHSEDDDDVSDHRSTITNSKHTKHIRNPIPAPIVVIRSEYPSLTRLNKPQVCTCLVTIEVPKGRWKPRASDLDRALLRVPQTRSMESDATDSMDDTVDDDMRESDLELEKKAKDLYENVSTWHGLPFDEYAMHLIRNYRHRTDQDRFGKLRMHGTLPVAKDRHNWQTLECYLFSNMLICVREKRKSHSAGLQSERREYSLKGSIMIQRHLDRVEAFPSQCSRTMPKIGAR